MTSTRFHSRYSPAHGQFIVGDGGAIEIVPTCRPGIDGRAEARATKLCEALNRVYGAQLADACSQEIP